MTAAILIGTTNWVDHTDFYPEALQHGRRQRERLSYYAQHFPIVEVDTTFYGIPQPQVVSGWVERTPDAFRFNVKAYRSLTGHEREGRTPRAPTPAEVRDFLAALEPLRESGKLVAVHYQFPPWFTNRPDARSQLLDVRDRHPGDTVAIEFRHRSWFDGDAWPATEDLLRELDFVYVAVDAPQVGSATAPPHLAITSEQLCIVRFHGRNRRTWYRSGPTSATRFDYLYRPRELAEWVPAIEAVAAREVPVHVLMNNNARNYAVVNAYDMAGLLQVPLPRPPQPVLEVIRERDGTLPSWLENAPQPPPSADAVDEQQRDGQLELGV